MNFRITEIPKSSYILDESICHGLLGSNKYRKVQAILAREKSLNGIITFGSQYSNNILACSYWAKLYGVPFEGIIITDQNIDLESFPNMRLALRLGASLSVTTQSNAYCKIQIMKDTHSDYKWIPGGAHTAAAAGAYEELFTHLGRSTEVLEKVSSILLPFGTGTTAYGVWIAVRRMNLDIRVIGISVARDKERCYAALREIDSDSEFENLEVVDTFAGTYGQRNRRTEEARYQFLMETGIMPDPIYNSLVACYYYQENISNAFIVNTGGMLNNLL